MGKTWSLQDAKARFSELVRRAQTEGPQTVTVRGKPAVRIVPVITAPANDRALSGESAYDALMRLWKGPAFEFDLPEREKDGDFRDLDLE